MNNDIAVDDLGTMRKYRTEIPNIIFELGLTPHELTLYAHLKRAAGAAGYCWKSSTTLARECGMSQPQIIKLKRTLAQPRAELGDKPLIVIDEREGKPGRPRHFISITDVWPENFANFAPEKENAKGKRGDI